MSNKIKVTIWNEFHDEKTKPLAKKVYPNGIHNAIKEFLGRDDLLRIHTATLDENDDGLPQEVLDNTDVLIWWGHNAHDNVSDETVERVFNRILQGMGFIALHSSHASKIFTKLCGTASHTLKWREYGEKERLWVVDASHPIASGIGEYIELQHEEMYGERFDIPKPDELIFISWFEGGEVFRSGFTYKRGKGKIFYFRPGHEEYPTFYDKNIQRVINNAVHWAAPTDGPDILTGNVPPLEKISKWDGE